MPTVTELELFAVELPFQAAFRHVAATRTSSESLFRQAAWVAAPRVGESLPRAYVSGKRRAEAFQLLRDAILPALLGQSFQALPDIVSFLEECDGKPRLGGPPRGPQSSAWYSVAVSTRCKLLEAAMSKGRHDARRTHTCTSIEPITLAPTVGRDLRKGRSAQRLPAFS